MSGGSSLCLLLALLPDEETEQSSLLRMLREAIPGVSSVETGAGKRFLDVLYASDPVRREAFAESAPAFVDDGLAVQTVFSCSVLTVVLSVMLQRGCHGFLPLLHVSRASAGEALQLVTE